MKKKWIFIVIIIFVVIIISISFFAYKDYKSKEEIAKEEKRIELVDNIKSHYAKVVKVVQDTTLYKKSDDKMEPVGTISKDQVIELNDIKITNKTKYFYCSDIDLYISYKDVEPFSDEIIVDQRYKNYLLFDENVVTKDKVNLYENGNISYTLNYSIDKPIIMKEDNGYYIEYFNKLFFVSNDDVDKTYQVTNNTLEEASSVPVTCYHFIYLEGDTGCNEIICHSKAQIESHFKYLTENNYFTINTTELRYFIEGKLRLPKNTILVTIDDGARAENFIPLLEEYKINATLFLVSSWYSKEMFKSPYMEIASHTHDLHTGGKCPGGQGGWIKCLEHDKLLADFTTSRETLDGTEAFCYPFYEYNNYAISVLKEAGFKMAFAGGQKKATRGVDLFQIPRITIHNSTTLNEYINYVKP